MKILFLNAYFFPEIISFTHLEKDLIEGLVENGHELFVLAPTPTRGISTEQYEQYRKCKHEDLYDGRVHVTRFFAPREGKNSIARALRYFWCNIREYGLGKKYKDVDLIFAVSTPPTQGFLAGKLAKKLKCPFVYSLQDVFPDSLVTTGMTSEGSMIWKLGRKIENKTYAMSSRVVVISQAIEENLKNKGVSADKLVQISNWIDTDAVTPICRENNRLYDEFELSRDRFCVVYAGNFGAAQGADVVLQAAEQLKNNDDIQFVIFGGGSEYENAVQTIRERSLDHVFIHPLLPQERVPEVYSLGDVALITCKKGVGKSGMPSKTWSIMACNTPIVASFDTDSELAQIIKKSNAGVCVEPEDVDALVEAILSQKKKSAERACSRDYVLANASKTICVKKYLETLHTLCRK